MKPAEGPHQRTSDPGSDSSAVAEERRMFLQKRIIRFSMIASGMFFGFLMFRVFFDPSGLSLKPDTTGHVGAAMSLLLISVAARYGHPSETRLRTIEFIGMVAATLSTCLMVSGIPLTARPEFTMIMALNLAVLTRSIYVPSTGRNTLVLATCMGLIVIAAVVGLYWNTPPALLPAFEQSPTTSAEYAIVVAIFAAAWWACTTVLATMASNVIFGLRQQVDDIRQLGQYRLETKLGEGGMGAVFQASHALLRRPTAVKLLLPDKMQEAAVQRFEREVQLTAQLRHPNTVTIFDYGRTPDGVFYYAMELIDGATLDAVVELSGPLSPARARRILVEVAGALVEAHGVGVVHRDVKPSNIMLRMIHEHGGVAEACKVLDFGLVRAVTPKADSGVTGEGVVTGTPQYMSPEAITEPATVDARSDVYSLGAVGYYLLTGTHVFEGRTPVEVCALHLTKAPDPLSARIDRELPNGLERIILDCLEKDPAARPQSALDLQRRLQDVAIAEGWAAHESREWWDEFGQVVRQKREPGEAETTISIALRKRAV